MLKWQTKKLTAKAQALQKPSMKITSKNPPPKKKGDGNLKSRDRVNTKKATTDFSFSITPTVDKTTGKKIIPKKATPKKKSGKQKSQDNVTTKKATTDFSFSITPIVDKGRDSGLGVTSMVSEPPPVASSGTTPQPQSLKPNALCVMKA